MEAVVSPYSFQTRPCATPPPREPSPIQRATVLRGWLLGSWAGLLCLLRRHRRLDARNPHRTATRLFAQRRAAARRGRAPQPQPAARGALDVATTAVLQCVQLFHSEWNASPAQLDVSEEINLRSAAVPPGRQPSCCPARHSPPIPPPPSTPRTVYPVDTGLIALFDRSGKANTGHALETVVWHDHAAPENIRGGVLPGPPPAGFARWTSWRAAPPERSPERGAPNWTTRATLAREVRSMSSVATVSYQRHNASLRWTNS